MTWFGGIVIYIIIWWLVLFMTLPFGVRVPDEVEKGHATSAPEKPMIWRKMAATTVISAGLLLVVWWIMDSGLISFREP